MCRFVGSFLQSHNVKERVPLLGRGVVPQFLGREKAECALHPAFRMVMLSPWWSWLS